MNMAANYRELPATGAGKPSLHRNAKKSEKNANCSDFSHFSKKKSIFGCFAVFFPVFHFFPFQILSGQNPVSPVKPTPGNSWEPMGTLSPWDECMASKKKQKCTHKPFEAVARTTNMLYWKGFVSQKMLETYYGRLHRSAEQTKKHEGHLKKNYLFLI